MRKAMEITRGGAEEEDEVEKIKKWWNTKRFTSDKMVSEI